jgi:hypothetical protein
MKSLSIIRKKSYSLLMGKRRFIEALKLDTQYTKDAIMLPEPTLLNAIDKLLEEVKGSE